MKLNLLRFIPFVFIIVILSFSFGIFYYLKFHKIEINKNIVIEKGENLDKIISKFDLKWKKIIKIYLALTKKSDKIKAGSYIFSGKYTIEKIFETLLGGGQGGIKISIPEGFTVNDIKIRLASNGLINPDRFDEVLKKGIDFYYPHPNNNYEGYFFPATYYFTKGETEEKIIETFLKQFLREFPPEENPDKNKFYEKLIMASIIEKEAYFDNERAIIASVFYNRLEKNMKLESCATVEYIYNYKKSKLYYKDLEIESPYNTYLNYGLPPTPICNPRKKSIQAAFNPSKTDYLYFVATKSKNHIFSKTYKKHLEAQKNLDRK